MRRPFIAGNWKMNGTLRECGELARAIRQALDGVTGPELLVCPPFLALPAVRGILDGSAIRLGAQDLHWEAKGAFTGEVSAGMLTDSGCSHVLIGHSERRHVIGESNDMVARKVKAALAGGLTPVVCVGELLEERNMKVTREVIERQVGKAVEGVTAPAGALLFAYEPVWAIGTGLTATPYAAQEIHHFIRNLLVRLLGAPVAEATRILYGGSVKPDNAAELLGQADIDGLLVGGASLDPASFSKIARTKE